MISTQKPPEWYLSSYYRRRVFLFLQLSPVANDIYPRADWQHAWKRKSDIKCKIQNLINTYFVGYFDTVQSLHIKLQLLGLALEQVQA